MSVGVATGPQPQKAGRRGTAGKSWVQAQYLASAEPGGKGKPPGPAPNYGSSSTLLRESRQSPIVDRVYIQAKRYAPGNSVGRPEVQSFVGSLVGLGATKGVFVTTSSFSQHATEFAKNLSQRVILIDGQTLTDLMIEHNVGVRVSRALEFKRLDEDFFSEDE